MHSGAFWSEGAHRGGKPTCFHYLPKDGAESVFCSNMSIGVVDIYEVKRSQRHLLAAIENNRLGAPTLVSRISVPVRLI